ncbi:MAG: MGMT family protein [Candidatus Omnitrophica bacterium]|nr:MGMT family protein [Candidatus Omnitrophota bacterium]
MINPKGIYAVRFPKKFRETKRGQAHSDDGLFPLFHKLRERKLDLTGYSPFQRKVYAALRKVPVGKTVTYGELAKLAGYPGAARAVGTAMRKNRLPVVIPCHRVIPVSVPIPINFREAEIGAVQTTILEKKRKVWTGGLGEFSAGKKWKRWLLEQEVSGCRSVKVSEHQKCKGTH